MGNIRSQGGRPWSVCSFLALFCRFPPMSRRFRVDLRPLGPELFLRFIVYPVSCNLLGLTASSIALIKNNLRVEPERRGVRKSTRHYLRHRRVHMTHAGLAAMAVTARLGPAPNLKSQSAAFLVPDTDGLFHLGEEDFSVADISGRCRLENGIDSGIHQVLGQDQPHLIFRTRTTVEYTARDDFVEDS